MDNSKDNTDTSGSRINIFAQWFNASNIMTKGIQAAKDMYQAVYDIDTEMTELAKVSSATSSQLNGALNASTETAKKYGATISDVINSTSNWSRLGYNLSDSEKLAKAATIYKNIGDGIDMNTANKNLFSALQGYQLNADDALSIIDKFSAVAGSLPAGSSGIGEALQHSAASFYDANTSLSKSLALITGANSILQNPDNVGTMWETVSMRIRGADDELRKAGLDTEGMLKNTSQLRDFISGMTGFDIMTDDNSLKDVYDIVVGIGEKWRELTNAEQSSLLEKLAGNENADALNAALNNVDLIQKAYASAENSDGFALQAQEASLDTVVGKTQEFQAAFQSLSTTVMDSDLLKFFLDLGTTGVSALDGLAKTFNTISSLGGNINSSFGSIGALSGLYAGIKNVGRVKCYSLTQICLQ